MQVQALACTSCGAPIPPEAEGSTIACPFCHATMAIEDREAAKQKARSDARTALSEALTVGVSQNDNLYDVLRGVLASHFGRTDADEFARVVFALAHDFDRANGTSVRSDPAALTRLVEGVEKVAHVIAHTPDELNLPFLTATEKGPVHLQERITQVRYRELAARLAIYEPKDAPIAPEPVAPVIETEPKKKKWFFF